MTGAKLLERASTCWIARSWSPIAVWAEDSRSAETEIALPASFMLATSGVPAPLKRSTNSEKDFSIASWPICAASFAALVRSEEHTSELQSLMRISYAAFCLKKKHTNICRQYTHVDHEW